MHPLTEAIQRYEELTDHLAKDATRHFGAIGDPNLEGIRFYTFESLSGNFAFDKAVELGEETVDRIEDYLMQIEIDYSLFAPMLRKLTAIAPAFNSNGKSVFLGSWGMGPGEIGWMIRRINDRAAFERYLGDAGIGEDIVNRYNEACERDLKKAEQVHAADTSPAPCQRKPTEI